jgi:hypothetical protein
MTTPGNLETPHVMFDQTQTKLYLRIIAVGANILGLYNGELISEKFFIVE